MIREHRGVGRSTNAINFCMLSPMRLVFVACALALTGCGGLDEFSTTIEDSTTIPGMQMGGLFTPAFGGGFSGTDLSTSRSFTDNDTDPDDVDAIFITAVQLDLSTGGPDALNRLDSYLNSIVFWVQAPGLPRLEVARQDTLPEQASLELPVAISMTNLKPYVVATDEAGNRKLEFGADADVVPNDMRPDFPATLTTAVTLLIDINLF